MESQHFCLYSFTVCRNIVQIVSEILTAYPFIQFFDALLVRQIALFAPLYDRNMYFQRRDRVCFQCVSSGILIGCGMQKIAALSNLVAYYFIGLPVGTALMFAAQLKILGNDFI